MVLDVWDGILPKFIECNIIPINVCFFPCCTAYIDLTILVKSIPWKSCAIMK